MKILCVNKLLIFLIANYSNIIQNQHHKIITFKNINMLLFD